MPTAIVPVVSRPSRVVLNVATSPRKAAAHPTMLLRRREKYQLPIEPSTGPHLGPVLSGPRLGRQTLRS